MNLTLIILTTFFSLTFASPISTINSSSIGDSISHLLYVYLNPIFQSTLQQLTQLVFQLSGKLSQQMQHGSARFNSPPTAPWVSQVFGGMNSIATQWNNQITDFFSNIPTIFEKHERSAINFSQIKVTLYNAVENLLEALKKLFTNNVSQLLISIVNEFNLTEFIGRKRANLNIDGLLNVFQQRVSDVFDKTKEQLNRTIDDSIDFIIKHWNGLKDRFHG